MRVRSFIAVDPSPEVVGRIGEMIRLLAKQTHGFRWVDPAGMHLTLRFLGEVEPSVMEVITERLSAIARSGVPFRLNAKEIGFFPSIERPRVVWAGLEGEVDRFISLQAAVEEAVRGLSVHQEKERAVTPHLTIARIKDFRTMTGVAKILQVGKGAAFGEFLVEKIALYKSSLTPQGARYTKLGEFLLGK